MVRSRNIAGYDEFLAQRALDLQPIVRAPGSVRPIGALGDDALEAHEARLPEQRLGGVMDGREAIGPVVATAGQDSDPALVDPYHEPITVPLDLVDPLVTV